MAKQWALLAFALGVLILGFAVFMPTLINTTQQDTSNTMTLGKGEDANLTQRLKITALNVSDSNNNATIEWTHRNTLETNQTVVTETTTANVTLDGDRLFANLTDVDAGNNGTFTLEYPPMFGWHDGARVFVENMDIILAMLSVAFVMGLIWLVIP